MTLNALAAYAQVTSPDRVNVQGGGKIDRTEVTARMYAECVNFGACPVPKCAGSALPAAYDDNYPVACVDFSAAQSYCQFAGARLPTDAEWNLAAHGSGGSEFPWGTAAPSCVQANIHVDAGDGCGTGRAAPAGDRPAGASASGAVNLFGNVAEWVDWSPGDPKTTPSDRPIKGGSYNSTADELAKLKSGAYQVAGQTEQQPTIGFRCFAP